MADTVKARAMRYALARVERKYDGLAKADRPPQKAQRLEASKLITPSLLALARINLAREVGATGESKKPSSTRPVHH